MRTYGLLSLLCAAALMSQCGKKEPSSVSNSQSVEQSSSMWMMGYYPGWFQGKTMPADKIDYSAMTHVAHFALMPTKDGGLEGDSNVLTPQGSISAVAEAHKAGRKILISIGGWASEEGFRGATSDANLSKFVDNMIAYMQKYGYDGIDLDWEILRAKDKEPFVKMTKLLRERLNKISPDLLLTAASQWEYPILKEVHPLLDQINLMTYDLSGPWPGTVTWHHSSLFGNDKGRSVDSEINKALKLGIPASKLGVGLGFYGYVWTGVAKPMEAYGATAPKAKTSNYNAIMEKYGSEAIKWDDSASAPYISIDKEGTENDVFITFDNEFSIRKKLDYVRGRGLGGAIIWSLGGDIMKDGSMPLLKAVKNATASETKVAGQ